MRSPEFNTKCPIPNHITWVTYICDGVPKYIITSKKTDRNYYYLYTLDGDEYVKIARAKSPNDLNKNIKGGR